VTNLPIATMWETRGLRCVIGVDPTSGRYVVAVVNPAEDAPVLEEVVTAPDDALDLARTWSTDSRVLASAA
jgi:hypothetical protein